MKTFVDLFCGGGLGARGAVAAGLTPLLAVDNWDIACETYRANFPSALVLNQRIELLSPTDHLDPGSIDLLLASPECTNHSVAKGAAPRSEESRETALYTASWIGALKPKWFIIENVKEMMTWHRYDELLAELKKHGYRIKVHLINAADFGAPQARLRLFLVGGLNQDPPEIRSKTKSRKVVTDILDPHGTWPETLVHRPNRAKSTLSRVAHARKALGKDADFLLVYYGSAGERSWQTLDKPLRTITTVDRFALVRRSNGKDVMRMLQPVELARAMSISSSHLFPFGTRREKVKLCGNGVCATVVEQIVKQLIDVDARGAPLRTGRSKKNKAAELVRSRHP